MFYTYGKEYYKKDDSTNIMNIKYKIDNRFKADAIADTMSELVPSPKKIIIINY